MSVTLRLAEQLLELCIARGALVATAESCTGGMVAAAVTDVAGSSAVLDRGFVTYSNAAKMELLGVPQHTLDQHGAVSQETAESMAGGALVHSQAHVAVAVTGIAGPGGGSADKPVGLVWFAAATGDGVVVSRERRWGDRGRTEIRRLATLEALTILTEALDGLQPVAPFP